MYVYVCECLGRLVSLFLCLLCFHSNEALQGTRRLIDVDDEQSLVRCVCGGKR